MTTATLVGTRGGVSAGHPFAVEAGLAALSLGGGAVDAAIAAQAALCVVMPQAAGLGGDGMSLVYGRNGEVNAVNGCGPAPLDDSGVATIDGGAAIDGGASVTLPGVVDSWGILSERWGLLSLAECLAPAVRLATEGIQVDDALSGAVSRHRPRLIRGGAGDWSLLHTPVRGLWTQPELAEILFAIGRRGPEAFYAGPLTEAMITANRHDGGALALADFISSPSTLRPPVSVDWAGGVVHVQPPSSQGVLLAMALRWLENSDLELSAHLLVELTEAVFVWRDHCAEGEKLLAKLLEVDPAKAAQRGGPRPYLHTAGVATCDDRGTVVSSLVSVFDDFGSATFVPEGGFVLNNRAGGFNAAPNDAAGAKRPVHTLAPAIVHDQSADVIALATPGADGQVQTLLQVIASMRYENSDLASAIAKPRWRSQGSRLLIERSHPACAALAAAGHDLDVRPDGGDIFGAVVAAGLRQGVPVVAADWRRQTWAGVL